ncbi:hypothetical protein [Aeromonas caviae]|uniref:hypothetical protein n=1 Tax=Aeromonas caviae TaxID=648 RepID=UPI002B4A6873|nr:hypothetical protein [Aeromonas caviae]
MLSFEERMALLKKKVESLSKEELLQKLTSYPAEGPIATNFLHDKKYHNYSDSIVVYSSEKLINNGFVNIPAICFVDTTKDYSTLKFTFDSTTIVAGNDEFYCTNDTISWAA